MINDRWTSYVDTWISNPQTGIELDFEFKELCMNKLILEKSPCNECILQQICRDACDELIDAMLNYNKEKDIK